MNSVIPVIPQLDSKFFDGSTNEQFGFEGEVDRTSPALQARYRYVRKVAAEIERDLADPQSPSHERVISSLILQYLAGNEISKEEEALILYPFFYLVLETHIFDQDYDIEIFTAITEFIAKTVDPQALSDSDENISEGMTDVDIFFSETAGMEMTAGIFIVAKKTIDALNEYSQNAWAPSYGATSATLQ